MTSIQYMDSETVSQVQSRVTRLRQQIEDQVLPLAERMVQRDRHAYLCEIEQAVDLVVSFLNGEHQAFKERDYVAEEMARRAARIGSTLVHSDVIDWSKPYTEPKI